AGGPPRPYTDRNGNASFDSGEPIADTTTTGAGGSYSLSVTPGAKYVVCETQQSGWHQSQPSNSVCAGAATGGYAIASTSSNQTISGNDFGNYRNATISGLKYEDQNANGSKDSGDLGLAGWTITAYTDSNGNGSFDSGEPIADTTTTGAGGSYSLSVTPGAKYVVCETQQSGWHQSQPSNSVCAGAATGGYAIASTSSNQTISGNDFGNYRNATISGLKYEDQNANGSKDSGDLGLAGWTITAYTDSNGNGSFDSGEAIADTTTTGAGGSYSLSVTPGAKYVVCETQQSGWHQSQPSNSVCAGAATGGYAIASTSSNQTISGNDFGNYRNATISGLKYEDQNANGSKDSGDLGLAGWTITAYTDSNGNGSFDSGEPIADTTTTGAGGSYSLSVTPGAKYVVCETQQSGWHQSQPSNSVCAGAATGGYAIASTSSNQTISGNDFGNYRNATISGLKYEDQNANGSKDSGDLGLAGWTITAYTDSNGNGSFDSGEPIADTTTTGAGGSYSLSVTPGAKYVVCETQQSGWHQSQPSNSVCAGAATGGYAIASTSSNQTISGNDFGNYRNATISGLKYEDQNANGSKDSGDLGLAGWTITAYTDSNGNGSFDSGEPIADTTTTGAGGSYSLSVTPGAKYVVCETQQSGWHQSQPSNSVCAGAATGGYAIASTSSNQTISGNDFGNYRNATISGLKYEDQNANGSKDSGDLGLAGWTITAYTDSNGNGSFDSGEPIADTTTTGAGGSYSLSVTPGAKYVVCETQQSGWHQSQPSNSVCAGAATGGYAIASTSSNQTISGNDFGNYRNATISGLKYEDQNANGSKDSGDLGLAGWTITAYTDSNGNGSFDSGEAIADTTTTGAGGSYSLSVTPGAKYVVCETQQSGWHQSQPSNSVCAGAATGGYAIASTSSNQTISGNDFGNYRNATISGLKYEDQNANGSKDSGDLGLAGWTITAYTDSNGNGSFDSGEPIADTTTTGAGGSYSLSVTPGAKYVVCETQQSGWHQSQPSNSVCAGAATGGYAIASTSSNQTISGNDFGNYRNATISGLKYEDQNANGSKDSGDLGLAGWTITAYTDSNGNGSFDSGEPIADTTTTGAGGSYSLSVTPGAKYVVCETQQSGWHQSQPSNSVCAGAATGGYAIASTSSNQTISGNDFGNYRNATISGLKYEDQNASGSKDSGDLGLAGWTITAYTDSNGNGSFDSGEPIADTTTTGAGGSYSLSVTPGAKYVVCETQQSGWHQSQPSNSVCAGAATGGYAIASTSSNQTISGNDFGNYRNATISGLKYEDQNANGSKDSGDLGLAGWTITAYTDSNGNGSFDSGEPIADTTTTGAGGSYSLSVTPGAKYVVCETQQSGWHQSQPSNSVCAGAATGGYAI